MANFRKKPIQINAWQASVLLECAKNNWKGLPEPISKSYEEGNILFAPREIHIKTLEGWIVTLYADWVIQGVKGELYSCKPDIFKATYEKVD